MCQVRHVLMWEKAPWRTAVVLCMPYCICYGHFEGSRSIRQYLLSTSFKTSFTPYAPHFNSNSKLFLAVWSLWFHFLTVERYTECLKRLSMEIWNRLKVFHHGARHQCLWNFLAWLVTPFSWLIRGCNGYAIEYLTSYVTGCFCKFSSVEQKFRFFHVRFVDWILIGENWEAFL